MIGLWFRRMVSSVGENKNLTVFLLSTQYVFLGFFSPQTSTFAYSCVTDTGFIDVHSPVRERRHWVGGGGGSGDFNLVSHH